MKPWQQLLFGLCFGLLTAGILLLVTRRPSGQPVELLLPPTPAPIVVHIAGAVREPGVYQLPVGSRVVQAVNAAGGFADQANQDGVNLAAILYDGMKLQVPALGEELATEIPRPEGNREAAISEPVNVNTASEEELMRLPNIGPTRAKAILQYREHNGPFISIEQLMNVTGIGIETFESIREMVIVR